MSSEAIILNLEEQLPGHRQVTIIRPARGWRSLDVKELWAYRELLWVLTMRDIKVRYKQTVLGVAWAVIQPLMLMIVFSLLCWGASLYIPPTGEAAPGLVISWNIASSTRALLGYRSR